MCVCVRLELHQRAVFVLCVCVVLETLEICSKKKIEMEQCLRNAFRFVACQALNKMFVSLCVFLVDDVCMVSNSRIEIYFKKKSRIEIFLPALNI